MRFHTLTIMNLNSLAATHVIPFEEALGGADLFLIHGPTGAGKSTLLDAICLALYGKTPRFDGSRGGIKVDGERGSSPAHLMTRGTWRAESVLEFSLVGDDGLTRRYRAGWSVRRAKDRPDGNLQDATRRLERWGEAAGWEPLVDSAKQKDYEPVFTEILEGLSFHDFLTTALLAQFAFRQFLDADEKGRSELLERLTGEGQYLRLGAGAAKRRAGADREVAELEAQGRGVSVLDEAARAAVARTLAEHVTEREALGAEATRTAQLVAAWERQAEAEAQVAAADRAATAWAGAREAAAGRLAALDADERVGPAREALTRVEAMRREVGARQAEREAAKVAHDAALELEARCREAAGEAVAARGEAEAELERQGEALGEARTAWSARGRAQEVLAEREDAVGRRVAEAEAREVAWVGAAQAVGTAAARREAAEAARDGVPQREELKRSWRGIEEELARVERERTNLDKQSDINRKLDDDVNSLKDTLGQHEAARDAQAATLEAARGAVERAQAAERALGAGEPVAALDQRWRAEERTARDQLAQCARAEEAWHLLRKAAAEREALAGKRGEVQAAALSHVELVEARREALAAREAVRVQARKTLDLLGSYVHLAALRAALTEEAPCPLCGGLEHPFVHHPERAPTEAAQTADRQEAKARLEAAEGAEREAREALREAEKRAERLHAEREHADEATREAEKRLEGAEAAWKAAQEQLQVETGAEVAVRREEAERRCTHAIAQLEALSEASAASRHAQEHERECSKKFEEIQKNFYEHERRYAELAERLRAHRAQEATQGAEQAEREEALVGRLRALELPVESWARAMKAGQERLRAVTAAEEAVRGAGEEEATARIEQERARAAREAARAEADAARARWAEARGAAEAAAAEVSRWWAGRDPAEVERELRARVEEAQRSERGAQEALAQARAAAARGGATLEGRAAAWTAAVGELDAREAELSAIFQELEIADAEAVRALTLDAAARGAARAERERLETERHQVAAGVAAARSSAAAAEVALGEAGGDVALGVEDGRAAAREGSERIKAAIQVVDQAIGAVRETLARDEEALARQGQLAEALTQARGEQSLWQQIDELIGVRAGRAFVDLVQALNLQRVLELANARLSQFMNRYELLQVIDESGRPRVDFVVRDRQQGDAQRAVASLSGGESFIVSLALALGLADLRGTRLKVETLLIDEGFGALDGQTLREVLSALAALQAASGVQIGLISHVEAMRELIPAQIEVVPVGDGCSEVRMHA